MLTVLLCTFLLQTAWQCHGQFWEDLNMPPEILQKISNWTGHRPVHQAPSCPGVLIYVPKCLPIDLGEYLENADDNNDDVFLETLSKQSPMRMYDDKDISIAARSANDSPSEKLKNEIKTNRDKNNAINLGLQDERKWWTGPNVCESTNETSTGQLDENVHGNILNATSCKSTPTRVKCTNIVIRGGYTNTHIQNYVCCPGYQRIRGETDCVKVDIKPLMDTLRELGGKEFLNLVESTGLDAKFEKENLTVFMPTDKALEGFIAEMDQGAQEVPSTRRRRDLSVAFSSSDLILNHVVKGTVDIYDKASEDTISSEYMNTSIRLNMFFDTADKRIYTADCIPISNIDKIASNGMVYVIDRVIKPAIYSIQKIIENSNQLSILKQIFLKPETGKMLNRKKPFTLFAPTNEALRNLGNRTLGKLLNGDICALDMLRRHIFENTVCSIDFGRKDVRTHIRDAKFHRKDIMASNGVIHAIDSVLFNKEDLSVIQTLEEKGFTQWVELIEEAGLTEQLWDLNSGTMFVPDNKANISETLDELRSSEGKLKDALRYHFMLNDPTENRRRNTLLDGHIVWFYKEPYSADGVPGRASVNCEQVDQYKKKTCGFNVLQIRTPLTPPSKTIMQVIEEDSKYSILCKLIKDTEIEAILKNETAAISFLAPPDEVFQKMEKDNLGELLKHKDRATEMMKRHILTMVLCCSDVSNTYHDFRIPTLSQTSHVASRRVTHEMHIGNALVTQCDTVTVNGVLHEVNAFLQT